MVLQKSKVTAALESRFDELDSLRGLAACSVVVGHLLNTFMVQTGPYQKATEIILILRKTPLKFFFSGHNAVIIFFILSGFVLSLKYLSPKKPKLNEFLIRRFFRIYLPYFVALTVAVVANAIIGYDYKYELSNWFNKPWSKPITWIDIINHVLFLGIYPCSQFIPVLWSLIHELRISLLFPAIMYFVNTVTNRALILLSFGLQFFAITLHLLFEKIFGSSVYLKTDVAVTFSLQFTGLFILGFVIARNYKTITIWYKKCRHNVKIIFLFCTCFFYYIADFFPIPLSYYADIVTSLGATGFIILSVTSSHVKNILLLPAVKFVGKISYSLYLYHCIIILSVFHLFYGKMPIVTIIGICLFLTFTLSWLSYNYIEKSAIYIGRIISKRVS
jgi:peptidoglycan/LPS O-acetylase OafA/YrhL